MHWLGDRTSLSTLYVNLNYMKLLMSDLFLSTKWWFQIVQSKYILSINFYHHPMKWILLSRPFYEWEKQSFTLETESFGLASSSAG